MFKWSPLHYQEILGSCLIAFREMLPNMCTVNFAPLLAVERVNPIAGKKVCECEGCDKSESSVVLPTFSQFFPLLLLAHELAHTSTILGLR